MTSSPTAVTQAYAGFWRRVLAAIIDNILWGIIAAVVLWLAYGRAYFDRLAQGLPGPPLEPLMTWVVPTVATIAFWVTRGATPGKMAVGARIVDARTGATPSLGRCIVRYLAYFVSVLPFGIGLIWVAFDPRKQGWHDKIAGTLVVRDRSR